MTHRKTKIRLGRVRKVRSGLLKSLAVSLIRAGRITTTQAKAKFLVPKVERYVTYAKKGNLHSTRLLSRVLPPASVQKLVKDIAPKYKDRRGGYTRIIKKGPRVSDAAPMVIVEFI